MPSAQPPSPSPPPSAPVAATPGARAKAFIELYNGALNKTLTAVSYESFAACFPLIAQQAPGALRTMHGTMVGRLEKFAQDEFENILHERAVIANLNKLDDLISDAQKRKSRSSSTDSAPIPPHTLPAASLLLAHTTPLHQSQQSLLNAKLQTTESQNATLIEEVRRQRKEIEALLMLGEGVVRDLEGAGGRLAERGGELAREGREAEGVLGGS